MGIDKRAPMVGAYSEQIECEQMNESITNLIQIKLSWMLRSATAKATSRWREPPASLQPDHSANHLACCYIIKAYSQNGLETRDKRDCESVCRNVPVALHPTLVFSRWWYISLLSFSFLATLINHPLFAWWFSVLALGTSPDWLQDTCDLLISG